MIDRERVQRKAIIKKGMLRKAAGTAILSAAILITAACGSGTEEAASAESSASSETPAAVPSPTSEATLSPTPEAEENANMGNPWSETEDAEEAAAGSGIRLNLPTEETLPAHWDSPMQFWKYRWMEGTIEALYENVNDEMRIRVSMDMAGEELAGDYTSYSQNWDESIQGITVRCKGDGETINNALFDAEDLHYAILYNAGDEGYGLTADELNAIVTGMQIAEYPEEPEMAETENAGVPAATADPTDESVPAGGSCLYIATAENADYYEWHAVSQDGSIDIPYAEIATWFPELQYSGEDSEYLSLSNIPLEFNGWSSYCRFTNDAGTSDSGKAVTYVQNDNTAG